ncbi:MAG: hypothetical protein ACTSUV_03790 [Candidatus Ranarchaeia archaeon]
MGITVNKKQESLKLHKRAMRALKSGNIDLAAIILKKAGDEIRSLDTEKASEYYNKSAAIYLKNGTSFFRKEMHHKAASYYEKAGSIYKNKIRNSDAAWECYIKATECRLQYADTTYRDSEK